MSQPVRMPLKPSPAKGMAVLYADKPATYFDGARLDIVDALATDERHSILELGCGSGSTGVAVLAAKRAGTYVGIEIDPSAASIARQRLTQVHVGDVTKMDLGQFENLFDALIISEVLEHLTDPETTLKALSRCLKPGGRVYASSPNVAHWRIILHLLKGRFEYADDGVMDRTHMRWFTPASFRRMFEAAGVKVESIGPIAPLRPKARLIDWISGGKLRHLFMTQIMVVGARA